MAPAFTGGVRWSTGVPAGQLFTGADPAVAIGFRRYLREWYAAGNRGADPVSLLIAEAVGLPPGSMPPRPDLSAPVAHVLAWADSTAEYHARREQAQHSPVHRAECQRRQHALRLFAEAIRDAVAALEPDGEAAD